MEIVDFDQGVLATLVAKRPWPRVAMKAMVFQGCMRLVKIYAGGYLKGGGGRLTVLSHLSTSEN